MRIAAYCRVSTDRAEQQDSFEHQKEFFEEFANKNNHSLVHVYADEGISGTKLKKRDQFLRMMQDANLGLFEMVVVKDVSRMARNTVDFLQSIRTLKSYGINTLFVTANMDSLGESEFILTLFGAMAQEESANLSKRVKFGKKINAEKGRVPQRIFGYNRIDNFTLEINQKEAEVVRNIYQMYLHEGLGCRKISVKLNQADSKTKYGCEWNPRGVRKVLANPIYCGHYINNKYEIADFLTGKQVRIPKEQHFHHDRPEWAIVSQEEFDEAQCIMNDRRQHYDSGGAFMQARYSSKHIFSTLIKCEHCGRSYCRKTYTYVNTRTYWKCVTNDQHTAQFCDNKVKLEEVELVDKIREYLFELIEDKDKFISEIIDEINKHDCYYHNDVDIKSLKKRQQQLTSKKERFQEMYVNDIITISELKAKMNEISEELAQLDFDIGRYENPQIGNKSNTELAESYRKDIQQFLSLETITNQDMRRIIDHINVNKSGKVTIILRDLSKSGTF